MFENLDVAATLAATPPSALASPIAAGARFDVSIDDACSTGGLLGCSPERVTSITDVTVNGAVANVRVEDDSNKLSVEGVTEGDTALTVTARFEGEDAGERTATLSLRVREVSAVDVELWCDRDASVAAVPPGVILTTTLAYLGSNTPGGDERVSLWHHDVQWAEEIVFDGEQPDGFADAPETSPATVGLEFSTPGWSTAVDAATDRTLLELLVYDATDITELELDAPASLNVEEQGDIRLEAAIGDLGPCVDSPDVVVEAVALDPSVCGLGGLGVDSWVGDMRDSVPVTGTASGLCEVEVLLPDAGLSAVAAIDVIATDG